MLQLKLLKRCRNTKIQRRTFGVIIISLHIFFLILFLILSNEDDNIINSNIEERKKIKTELLQINNYQTSDPFITGDGFRSICHLIFEEKLTVSEQNLFLNKLLETVKEKKKSLIKKSEVFYLIIFVQTHLMDKFISCCLRHLPKSETEWQLILISHNSDVSAPFNSKNLRNKNNNHNYNYQLDWILNNPKVKAWYATNTAIEHPKLWPIPIGIENLYNSYGKHINIYKEAFQHVLNNKNKKKINHPYNEKKLLFVSFGLSSYYKYRSEVMRIIKKNFASHLDNVTFIYPLKNKKNKNFIITETYIREYLKLLQQHYFVLAPRGNGMDTHRLWETLYMGSIPIIEQSAMDTKLLSKLPILIVENFANVTPELLTSEETLALRTGEKFYNNNNNNKTLNLLLMSYWRQVITGKEEIS